MADDRNHKNDTNNEEEDKATGFSFVGSTDGVGHGLYPGSPNCPKCGAPPSEQEIRNHSLMWHDGDIHCKKCGTYVRVYDAG